MLSTILIVVLILLLLGALPTWALQLRLGLLPWRRPRSHPHHSDYSGPIRTDLSASAVGKTGPV
jgi:hypothetical protein